MAITPKALNLAQKIYKRVFYGKPYIFSTADINQLQDLDANAFEQVSKALGAYSANFTPVVSDIAWDATDFEVKIVQGSGGYVYYNKVRFDIPAFTVDKTGGNKINHAGVVEDAVLNVWLAAKRSTIDFSADNSIGGITGSGFPSPLPSSDAKVFSDERVVVSIGVDTAPSLNPGEEVVVLLYQMGFEKHTGNPLNVTPIGIVGVPQLEDIASELAAPGVGTFAYSSPTGIIGHIIASHKWVRNLLLQAINSFTGSADTLMYTTSGGEMTPTAFTPLVNDRLRNYAHAVTKLWSYTTANTYYSFDNVSGILTLNTSSNHHHISLPSGSIIKDIKINNGGSPTVMPYGTPIWLTLSVSGGVGTVAMRFYPTDVASKIRVGAYTGTVSDIGCSTNDSIMIQLVQYNTVWWAYSYSIDKVIAGIQSDVSNVLTPVTNPWVEDATTTNWAYTTGAGTVTASTIQYHIVGKTIHVIGRVEFTITTDGILTYTFTGISRASQISLLVMNLVTHSAGKSNMLQLINNNGPDFTLVISTYSGSAFTTALSPYTAEIHFTVPID